MSEPKMTSEFDKPPYHVNEKGVKFWIDRDCTEWARREGGSGRPLKGAVVYLVEEPNGAHTRLLVDSKATPVATETALDAMGTLIDIKRLINNGTGDWLATEAEDS